MAAVARIATLSDGSEVFAKTLTPVPGPDLFEVEAEGLAALRDLGGVATPEAVRVAPDVLVLRALRPRPDTPRFWERLGRAVAALHTTTVTDRFGWHRDGWLGRMRQDNTWHDSGHEFYARRRILRWLPEPHVRAAFDREDRRALERLCERLPEIVPDIPASLTHGDLWTTNIIADERGEPVLVDPAVSYNWPETDISMLWCTPRPPESDHFFAAYEEAARPEPGWRERLAV
ncbi:fructosamine kinase family protein, partial [Thermobifida halotolerans]|uniref:fructosamine kinase family protein n=1 Tax=Thermobifida halotolerans TaxID=483545 RepID=UPI00373FDE77